MTATIPETLKRLCARLAVRLTDNMLLVSIPEQRLTLMTGEIMAAEYAVSTALNGPGGELNSEKTPLGLHCIAEKIGAGCEAGSIFRGRRATGQMIADFAHEVGQQDLITSRILWLDGLEEGINRGENVDSKQRYIYIHGTQDEVRIGQPVSHGCIRMMNADVIDLFEHVAVGDLVYIHD